MSDHDYRTPKHMLPKALPYSEPLAPQSLSKVKLPSWDSNAEAKRDALLVELDNLNARRTDAINRLSNVLDRCNNANTASLNLQLVIDNADALRDALEAFDSGARIATTE